MIVRNGKLNIFENFVIDRNLPKYKKEIVSTNINTGNFIVNDGGVIGGSSSNNYRSIMEYLHYKASYNLFNKFTYWFAKKFVFTHETDKIEKPNFDNIKEFFVNLHQSCKQLEITNEIDFYVDLIENARLSGQIALLENLKDKKEMILMESFMIKEGLNQTYIEEQDVVKYYEKAKFSKFLHLTWIKNYVRIIPSKVLERKMFYDEKKIFDNYVILHFDRTGESALMTKAEIEKAKDPILFGVLNNSNKLYFIADWQDEYCDLTLDKMLKVLGKDALTVNNETVRCLLN